MVRDGQLLMNRRGGYATAKKLDLIAGTVIANPDGFGFLKAEDGGDDLFLPPGEMRKALHGDRVLASVTSIDRRGRREGAIVEVLERRLTRLIGRYSERSRIGMVIPDDRRVLTEVLIPPEDRNERPRRASWWWWKSPRRRERPPADRPHPAGAGRQAHAVAGGGSRHPRPRPAARVPARGAGRGRAGAGGRARVGNRRPRRPAQGAAGDHRRRGRQGLRRRRLVRTATATASA